jgi:putative spermidine/putrescine transport system ATP-binding protein
MNDRIQVSIAATPHANVTGDIAVRLDGVAKSFNNTPALHEVSLQIRQGEFLTLLGPSGCGKTTLLNLIAGFAQADRGEIFIDGELMTDMPAYQREIGIVFQNYALFPHMTVAKNIGYGLKMRGVDKAEIDKRVTQALTLVKLTGYGERRPRELSGGQQQRVALARALVIRPKVLLLDEPFSALDKNLRGAMQVELKEIQRQLGVTTVFVTHDQGEALSMSDRIVVMSQGHIRQIAAPNEIYRTPTDPFVASFLGDVNIFPVTYSGEKDNVAALRLGDTALYLPKERIRAASGTSALELYVRPENIVLETATEQSLLTGTVVHHVFQGDHVDSYIDVASVSDKRVLVRTAGLHVLDLWPVGTTVGLAMPASDVTAFAAPQ